MGNGSMGSIVISGLRSVAASFPGFASIAQAWNEAETELRNRRINLFFDQLGRDLMEIKDRIVQIEKELIPRKDLHALLERTVEKVQREASDVKIRTYSQLLTNTIAFPISSYDEGINFIETLDTLTDQDLCLLMTFKDHPNIRVDGLVEDSIFSNNTAKMSRIIVSLSKLEGRGIIGESIDAGGALAWTGDAQDWYNRWKRKSFELLPFGHQFLRMIK